MNTIVHEWRKARKSHDCMMCRRSIEPGEKYLHQRNVDYGDIWTWHSCAHCEAMVDLLDLHSLAYDEGVTQDTVAECDPRTLFEARLLVYWRTQWRRKDGTLREIPGPFTGDRCNRATGHHAMPHRGCMLR